MSDLDDLTAADTAEQQRPYTPEYEDITIRLLSVGFSGGAQDMVLYPEDDFEDDTHGNIRVTFHTDEEAEFVAYAGHTQWHSLKSVPHRREKGTLRPNPVAMMQRRDVDRKREYKEGLGALKKRLASDVDD